MGLGATLTRGGSIDLKKPDLGISKKNQQTEASSTGDPPGDRKLSWGGGLDHGAESGDVLVTPSPGDSSDPDQKDERNEPGAIAITADTDENPSRGGQQVQVQDVGNTGQENPDPGDDIRRILSTAQEPVDPPSADGVTGGVNRDDDQSGAGAMSLSGESMGLKVALGVLVLAAAWKVVM